MKQLAILGSTGSIGTQTLDIVGAHPEELGVACLAAGSRVEQLIEQALRWRPRLAVIADESKYAALRAALEPLGIATAAGPEGMVMAATHPQADMVVTATVGYSGMLPTLSAIDAGKRIALANKETLVVAGELVRQRLERSAARIYPVDSEHSAIWQCLRGEDSDRVRRLVITASGGPFLHLSPEQMATVTAAQALKHPSWQMGDKITIDSATMLNKAFEIIEARWLFDIPAERIEPVIHPGSIVHSMVEFTDGAIKAQLGVPDMHLPISYALFGGERVDTDRPGLTLEMMRTLEFMAPDYDRFPCLGLAHEAFRRGGNAACVINAAGEVTNLAFRRGQIAMTDIYPIICHTLERTARIVAPELADLIATNDEARARAEEAVTNTEQWKHF